jgi:hypothetical protein
VSSWLATITHYSPMVYETVRAGMTHFVGDTPPFVAVPYLLPSK